MMLISIFRGGVVMVLLAILASSCAPPRKTKPEKEEDTKATVSKTDSKTTIQGKDQAKESPTLTPKEFVEAFVKDLSQGKAKVEHLAPEFKKTVSKPVTEEDRKLGYSDAASQLWLNGITPGELKTEKTLEQPSKDGVNWLVQGTIKSGDKLKRFLVRATSKTSPSATVVTWVSVTSATCEGLPKADPGDATEALMISQEFLDSVLGEQFTLAESLMSLPYKIDLAEPFGSNKTVPYEAKMLELKLKQRKGDCTGYKLSSIAGTNGKFTIMGQLLASEKSLPCTLLIGRDKTTGAWLVELFNLN